MNFFKNIFKGILIGIGAIIPGVSSGVICVILGIYEDLLYSVLNIFKDFKENIKFLFSIGTGIMSGMIIFGNILKYLFYEYPIQISFTFIGLVIGSIPSLIKQVEQKEKFKLKYLVYIIISMIIGVGMVVLEKHMVINSYKEFDFYYLILSGICMSVGVIVPGVSSTVILMLLGVYSAYLTAVAELYLPILFPIGIGLIIGSLICMKTIKFLLEKFYVETFYSIIGFTIGSVFVLYPGISFDLIGITSVLYLLIGLLISSSFENI